MMWWLAIVLLCFCTSGKAARQLHQEAANGSPDEYDFEAYLNDWTLTRNPDGSATMQLLGGVRLASGGTTSWQGLAVWKGDSLFKKERAFQYVLDNAMGEGSRNFFTVANSFFMFPLMGANDSRTGEVGTILPDTPGDSLIARFIPDTNGVPDFLQPYIGTPYGDNYFPPNRSTIARAEVPLPNTRADPLPSKLVASSHVQRITVDEWSRARGDMRLSCRPDGTGNVNFNATGLIPNHPYQLLAAVALGPNAESSITPNDNGISLLMLGGVPGVIASDRNGDAAADIDLHFCPLEKENPVMFITIVAQLDGMLHSNRPFGPQNLPPFMGGAPLIWMVGTRLYEEDLDAAEASGEVLDTNGAAVGLDGFDVDAYLTDWTLTRNADGSAEMEMSAALTEGIGIWKGDTVFKKERAYQYLLDNVMGEPSRAFFTMVDGFFMFPLMGAIDSRTGLATPILPETPGDSLIARIIPDTSGVPDYLQPYIGTPWGNSYPPPNRTTIARTAVPMPYTFSQPPPSKLVASSHVRNITVDEWNSARGRMRLSCRPDGTGNVNFNATGLIPNHPFLLLAVFVFGPDVDPAIIPPAGVSLTMVGGVPGVIVSDRNGNASADIDLHYCPLDKESPVMYFTLLATIDSMLHANEPIGPHNTPPMLGGSPLMWMVGTRLHEEDLDRQQGSEVEVDGSSNGAPASQLTCEDVGSPSEVLYVWASDFTNEQSDTLVVVNVDRTAEDYGSVLSLNDVGGTGLHPNDLRLSADGRTLAGTALYAMLKEEGPEDPVAPDLLFWDVSQNPLQPRLVRMISLDSAGAGGMLAPLPDGSWLATMMSSRNQGAPPGRLVLIDSDLQVVGEFPTELQPGDAQLPDGSDASTFAPMGLAVDTERNVALTADFHDLSSTLLVAGATGETFTFLSSLRQWSLDPQRGYRPTLERTIEVVDGNAGGVADVKFIPGDAQGRAFVLAHNSSVVPWDGLLLLLDPSDTSDTPWRVVFNFPIPPDTASRAPGFEAYFVGQDIQTMVFKQVGERRMMYLFAVGYPYVQWMDVTDPENPFVVGEVLNPRAFDAGPQSGVRHATMTGDGERVMVAHWVSWWQDNKQEPFGTITYDLDPPFSGDVTMFTIAADGSLSADSSWELDLDEPGAIGDGREAFPAGMVTMPVCS